jgi:DNA-binding transcriptional LysR family regulator
MDMIEIRHLRHIVALAEYGGFKKAAEAINISQPALSISIKMAEEWFGTRLFERKPRNITPTPFGEVVIEGAMQILSKVDEVKRDVDLLHGLQKGTLRLASDAFLIESLISPAIGSLKSEHPNLRIHVHTVNWDEMVDMLRNRQVEMILAAYPINPEEYQEDDEISYAFIKIPKPVFFVRKGHPLSKLKKIGPKELLEYPLAGIRLAPWYARWFSKALDKPIEEIRKDNVSIVCDNYQVIKNVVKHSLAVAGSAPETIDQELKEGSLVSIDINWKEKPIANWGVIGYLKDRILSPAAKVIIQEITKQSEKYVR